MYRTIRRLRARTLLHRARQIRRHAAARVRSDRGDTIVLPISVEHVDDPDLRLRLIRAAGVLGPSSIERLLEAWANLNAPYSLHLDLGDALIDDAHTMRRLESALDHLERQRIKVHLVGIDPHHPVLHG
jgi:hypothetical protein